GAGAGAPPRAGLPGGTVSPADPTPRGPRATAMGGARVVGGAPSAAMLAGSPASATQIDLGGRLVIPGINDAHVHVVVPEGDYLNTVDFRPGPGPTLAEIQALVAGGVAATPEGTWLFAFIGSNIFDDPQATRRALDPVAPHHPVALFAWTGHGIWIDTAAMAAL